MGTYNFEPSGDFRNDGWTVTGSFTSLNGAWSSSNDANYASSPASKGLGTVSFPQDITAIPAGSVISSITVQMRCSTGSGSLPTGKVAQITAAVQCADDTSAFKVNTIYPTSTITTRTVATYTQDPLAEPWDVHRLNNLLLQASCSVGVADVVRIHQLFAVVNYRAAPTVLVSEPSGTQNTAAPEIDWTYTQVDGDAQASVEYRIFTATQVSVTGFSPDTATPVFEASAEGDFNSRILPTALASDTYWIYLRSTSEFGAVSAWDSKQFTLVAPAPGIPGVDDPTGEAPPGQGVVSVVADPESGSAVLTLKNTSNILGTAQASVESTLDAVTWTTSNCTVTESSDYSVPGGTGWSWKLTASSTANMFATTGFEAIPSDVPITMSFEAFTPSTSRSVTIEGFFWDGDYNLLGSSPAVAVTDVTTTWSLVATPDTTPVGTVYVTLSILVTGCTSGEVHYIDRVGIMHGTNTPWSSGGQTSSNILDAWYSNCEGTPPAGDAWVPGPGTSVSTHGTIGTQGFDGSTCNSMTYTGVASSINIRAAGTVFTATSSGTAFTLNKPAGTASGDFMLAFVTSVQSSICTPPPGWQLIDTAQVDDGGTDAALFVLGRSAGPSEPSTWTGSVSVATTRISAVVVGWLGAADLSLQMIGEASTATPAALSVFTSATVANTDPGAWRVSAFMASDSGAAGTFTANTQPPAGSAIQPVSSAPSWTSDDSSATFMINRPPNVASGDLMIATVAMDSYGGALSPPSGWTAVQSVTGNFSPSEVGAFAIFKRTAGSSEPSSWTGAIGGLGGTPPNYPKVTNCVAYRNCAIASSQFVAQSITVDEASGGGIGDGTTIYTPSVTNTNAAAWRISGFAATTQSTGTWSSNETTLRVNGSINDATTGGITSAIFDSNGPVAPGSYSKYGTSTSNWDSAIAWEAFLLPIPTPPTPPANETSRASSGIGSANPFDVLAVFDSNGPIVAGNSSVTGSYSRTFQSAAAWVGIIRPSTPAVAGLVSSVIELPVDLASAAPEAPVQAGNQVTLITSMVGSSAGECLLTANFYRANQLISAVTQSGGVFNSTSGVWTSCSSTFDIPTGTTRIGMAVGVPDRAVSDVVYWDRSSIALGNDPTYRVGTAYSAHPIWSYPQIQYSDSDGTGFGAWQDVPGTQTNAPSFGDDQLLIFHDHTVVPLKQRKYRVRTVTYGLNGDQFTSPWGPDSEPISFVSNNWWLKDITDPDNNIKLSVKFEDFQVQRQDTGVQFQALGEDYPVVLTEGYKSDTFTIKMIPVNQDDYAAFMDAITGPLTPMFLQSDVDMSWWVVPLGPINSTMLATNSRRSNPLREVDVTFLEVAPVA